MARAGASPRLRLRLRLRFTGPHSLVAPRTTLRAVWHRRYGLDPAHVWLREQRVELAGEVQVQA